MELYSKYVPLFEAATPPARSVADVQAGVKLLVPVPPHFTVMLLPAVPAVLAVIVKSPLLGLFAVAVTPMSVLQVVAEASTVAMPEAQDDEVPVVPLLKPTAQGLPPLQVPLVVPAVRTRVPDELVIVSVAPVPALVEKLPLALAADGVAVSVTDVEVLGLVITSV